MSIFGTIGIYNNNYKAEKGHLWLATNAEFLQEVFMSVIMFCILLWVIGDWMQASGRDWEESEREADRRHRELMETKKNSGKKKVTRRVMRDVDGRYAAEEIEEEWE